MSSEVSNGTYDAARLVEIVKIHWLNGYTIDVVEVKNHEKMWPTKGEPGAYVDVVAAQPLLEGERNVRRSERIVLYPFTEERKVIVLTEPNRNWIIYNERIANIIRAQIARLQSPRKE